MKIYSVLILLIFFIGCQNKSQNDNKKEITYYNKVIEELGSSIKHNDIFLTFEFGDNKNVIKNKFAILFKEKFISRNNSGYTYTFVFDEHNFNNGYASFSTKYHNGKLYNFKLTVEPHDIMKDFGGTSDTETVQLQTNLLYYSLSKIYSDRYGIPIHRKNILYDKDNQIWINGNREIEISIASNYVNINYTDLSVLNKLEKDVNESRIIQSTNTKKDI